MTYNIRYDNPKDGDNAWPKRKDRVARLLGHYQPDIVGFQEALMDQVEDLEERMEDYDWVGIGRDDGWRAGELSPLFFRRDRLTLVQHNTFWLSERPEIPGSLSWDAAITRISTWARLRDRQSGDVFCVFNTHLDHRGVESRTESARLLRLKISEMATDLPSVLSGDFNFTEDSRAYAQLTGPDYAGLVSLLDGRYASASGHQGPTASFNNWKELNPEESRIDYVFVSSGIRVLSHRIIDDRFKGSFPSDHLPVLVELSIGAADEP